MRVLARRVAGVALAAVTMLLVGVLSDLPLAGEDSEDAILRLTWRLRSQEVGDCPTPTQADLDRLPVHMQNPDACIGPLPTYDLNVRVNGESRLQQAVSGGGARGDRPLYVLYDLVLPPGSHEVEVSFARQNEALEEELDMGRRLALEADLVLEPRTVTLVTRAGDTGELVVRRPR